MGKAARNHGGTGGHGCVPLPGERPNFNQHVLGDQVLLRLVNQKKQPEVASKLPIPSKYLQEASITMLTKLKIQKTQNIKNPSVGHAGHDLFNEEKLVNSIPFTSVNPSMQPVASSVSIVQLPLSPAEEVIPTRKITVSSIATPEFRVSSLSLNIVQEVSSKKSDSSTDLAENIDSSGKHTWSSQATLKHKNELSVKRTIPIVEMPSASVEVSKSSTRSTVSSVYPTKVPIPSIELQVPSTIMHQSLLDKSDSSTVCSSPSTSDEMALTSEKTEMYPGQCLGLNKNPQEMSTAIFHNQVENSYTENYCFGF